MFGTLHAALAPLGVPFDLGPGDVPGDPLWPLFPLLQAWPAVARGEVVAAQAALGDFSVHAIPLKYDLEILALAGAVFAVAGSTEQRRWAYDRLRSHAGCHIVVGGCAAYNGAVDHLFGRLAVALDETAHGGASAPARGARTVRAIGGDRVCANRAWRLAALAATAPASNEFGFADGLWRFVFADRQAQLPDAKGLHDIAALLSAPGTEMHVFDLLGVEGPKLGADPVLDDLAKAEYKARLAELDQRLDVADASGDDALANRLTAEQDALLAELRSAHPGWLDAPAGSAMPVSGPARLSVLASASARQDRPRPSRARCPPARVTAAGNELQLPTGAADSLAAALNPVPLAFTDLDVIAATEG